MQLSAAQNRVHRRAEFATTYRVGTVKRPEPVVESCLVVKVAVDAAKDGIGLIVVAESPRTAAVESASLFANVDRTQRQYSLASVHTLAGHFPSVREWVAVDRWAGI